MKAQRNRRVLPLCIAASCLLHALAVAFIPIGGLTGAAPSAALREPRTFNVRFAQVPKPARKPKPKPKPVVRVAKAPKPPVRRPRRPRRRSAIHRAPRPPTETRPKPEPTPEQPSSELEARVVPPPEPEEQAPPTETAQAPPSQPSEPSEQAPEPKEVAAAPAEPPPAPSTSEMVAMAPQPIAAGPETTPTAVDGPLAAGRRIDSTEQPKGPSAPDIGNPEVSRPAPASGGDEKRRPQLGLRLGGLEDRSALPGTAHRLGAPEEVAGPGGPVPLVVSPNPGGSSGGSPRLAAVPRPGPTGPIVRRGLPDGVLGGPASTRRPGGPGGRPGTPGPAGKSAPGAPGPRLGPSMGTGPGRVVWPGSGSEPGPAGPGQPIPILTSPRGTFSAPPRGGGGADGHSAGTGGGGGGAVVLIGGGLPDLLGDGPGGAGGWGSGGGGGTGGAGGGDGSGYGEGGKSRPGLGSPWGGDTGEPRYARAGSGGEGPGGYGSGDGGEGTGSGGGVGDGHGRGVGTGVGDGWGPGSGVGMPLVVLASGPGGGYGQGDTALPLGWPDGTETEGAPGFPWLQPGLGKAGGGGPGMFGGPHGYGSGGGYPGRGDKLTPGFGGVPGGTGVDIPPPLIAGGGGGGGGDGPGGPGLYGPLTVGGAPGGTGTGGNGPGFDGGGPGGLAGAIQRGLSAMAGTPNLAAPSLGPGGGFGGPGGSGSGTGGRAIAKGGPGGIYADLVGTFDIPVGVTNSDYNTDEVSVLNLLGVMRDRTNVRVTIDNRYVPIAYDDIKDTPMLWVSGHKPLTWTAEERAALQEYVQNGGTILIEDCHGPFEQVMPNEIRRTFGKELEPVPMDDELFKSFYVMDELPAGDVQERLPVRGLRMPDGRLGVIYSSNDYSDAWKVPRGSYVADADKEQAYRMGINWYVYILAHWRRGQTQAQATPKLPGMP